MFHFVTRTLIVLLIGAPTFAQGETWAPSQSADIPQAIGQILGKTDEQYRFDRDSHKQRTEGVLNQARNLADLASMEGKMLASQLRASKHNVSSKDGEQVIYSVQILIRGASKSPQEYQDAQSKFNSWMALGKPEALNAMGFFREYGLVGQKKDLSSAIDLYRQAANSGYQPAVYNLGIAELYKKTGTGDLHEALRHLSLAFSAGSESSARVCGMASFVAYRLADKSKAIQFAQTCSSPLAKLALSVFGDNYTSQQRFDFAKASLGSGVDDGLDAMQKAALNTVKTDKQFLYCKAYFLIRKRKHPAPENTDSAISECVDWSISQMGIQDTRFIKPSGVAGVKNYVIEVSNEIDAGRHSNPGHYSWSAPFLPFTLSDIRDTESALK